MSSGVSLRSRLAAEAVEFLHVGLLWLLVKPAFDPIDAAVSALPVSVTTQFWHSAVLAAVGVGVVRYYDPSWDLIRGFVVGVATTATFLSLSVFSGAERAADAGGSWGAFVATCACWLVALGVGVALAHPRTWRRFRAYFAV